MKKSNGYLLTLLLSIMVMSVSAQTDKEVNNRSSVLDRIYTGGNIGLQFGDVTNIQIAPIIGYRVTNDFSAGVGVQYQYIKFKRFTPELTSNNYGTSVFARYRIKSPIFLQAEYEYLNYEYYVIASESLRSTLSSIFVGGGISQPLGGNASFTLMAMYNLSYDEADLTSPYSSPLRITGGINLGF